MAKKYFGNVARKKAFIPTQGALTIPIYYLINIGLSPVTYSTSVWKMKLYFPNGGAVRNGTKTNINEIIYRNCESALRWNERFFPRYVSKMSTSLANRT